ncbi:hypothetical protein ACJX0J_023567 [Zea mays]
MDLFLNNRNMAILVPYIILSLLNIYLLVNLKIFVICLFILFMDGLGLWSCTDHVYSEGFLDKIGHIPIGKRYFLWTFIPGHSFQIGLPIDLVEMALILIEIEYHKGAHI